MRGKVQKNRLFLGIVALSGILFLGLETVKADTKEAITTFSLTAPTTALSIESASNLSFSPQELSSNAISTTSQQNASITINDLRGTGAGWNVKAQLGEFVDNTDQNKTLKGVIITLGQGETTTVGDQTNVAPEVPDTVTLPAGGDNTLLVDALENEGNGSWTIEYDKDNVTLTAPSGQFVGDYTAKLTYTLIDGPNSN